MIVSSATIYREAVAVVGERDARRVRRRWRRVHVNYAQQNGLRLLEVGATRPICPRCAALIDQAGAVPVTPLQVVP
jgi:hypothetical protein